MMIQILLVIHISNFMKHSFSFPDMRKTNFVHKNLQKQSLEKSI